MKTQRLVKIRFKLDSWLVSYETRSKGQWHTAAQFYAKDHSLEWVKDWVSKQSNLKLNNP